jgi:hypothetical protein
VTDGPPSLPELPQPGSQDEPGRAFASGGAADVMEPGPQLATLADEAWRRGLEALSDDELIGVLRAARRLASRAAALELSAVAGLAGRRRAEPRRLGDAAPGEHVDAEVGLALTLTQCAAARLQDLALGVTRLPGVIAALSRGRIDQPKAAVIADETAALDHVTAAAVAAVVIPDAPGQTTGQLRAAVRMYVRFADPEAAQRRKETAQKQARVELWPEPAGTCALAGRDLPPAFALAADKHLSAAARWLRAHGAEGSLSQLRARAYLALLTGQPLDILLPTSGDTASRGSTPVPGTSLSGAVGPGLGETGRPALAGSVNLTLPLATWLGWAQSPGLVPGFGPLDAADSRVLAGMLAAHPATRWCLTLTDQAGRPLAHGCARASPEPPATGSAGPAPGTPGPAAGTPGPAAGTPGPAVLAWLVAFDLVPLSDGPCDHTRASPGYRPPRRMAHLARVRNPTCTHPGCRHPAARADLDHTVPHHLGGLTCLCNLGPRCRRHHRIKQAVGWAVTQPTPGTFITTTPAGRQYTTTAARYPV